MTAEEARERVLAVFTALVPEGRLTGPLVDMTIKGLTVSFPDALQEYRDMDALVRSDIFEVMILASVARLSDEALHELCGMAIRLIDERNILLDRIDDLAAEVQSQRLRESAP